MGNGWTTLDTDGECLITKQQVTNMLEIGDKIERMVMEDNNQR